MLHLRSLRALSGALAALLLIVGATTVLAGRAAPAASAAGDCTADAALDSEEQLFIQLINNHRAQNGRPALAASYKLSKASQWKSNDMGAQNYFAHDDKTRSWSQRIRDCGYGYNTWMGENIAAGNSGAQATFDQWRNSPDHNTNMLSTNYTAIGIGRAYVAGSTYRWYWTTDFGGTSDGWPGAPPPAATSTPVKSPTPAPTSTSAAACYGDINGDGRVDSSDLSLVSNHQSSFGPYDPRYDVNKDRGVNSLDLLLVAKHQNLCTAN